MHKSGMLSSSPYSQHCDAEDPCAIEFSLDTKLSSRSVLVRMRTCH